ncbi:MAG TPA: hypothetical protein VFI20_10200 [Terracidiphilus sp.]|nr:hypothetical protein [Terracidiphilus sp.]
MVQFLRSPKFVLVALLAMVAVAGCRQQEKAVAGVAQNAVNAEHKAQANATRLAEQRTELAQIPLPTKSMYIDVHDPSAWANPFLAIGKDSITVSIFLTDANPSKMGEGTFLRPAAARRQEIHVRPSDLAEAIVALPPQAWRYGRVVAVAENPEAGANDRAGIRRNMEAAIQKLNNLGVVVEEWPSN